MLLTIHAISAQMTDYGHAPLHILRHGVEPHSEMVTPGCHLDLLQTTGENGSVIRLNISFAKDPINQVSRKELPKDTDTDQIIFLQAHL